MGALTPLRARHTVSGSGRPPGGCPRPRRGLARGAAPRPPPATTFWAGLWAGTGKPPRPQRLRPNASRLCSSPRRGPGPRPCPQAPVSGCPESVCPLWACLEPEWPGGWPCFTLRLPRSGVILVGQEALPGSLCPGPGLCTRGEVVPVPERAQAGSPEHPGQGPSCSLGTLSPEPWTPSPSPARTRDSPHPASCTRTQASTRTQARFTPVTHPHACTHSGLELGDPWGDPTGPDPELGLVSPPCGHQLVPILQRPWAAQRPFPTLTTLTRSDILPRLPWGTHAPPS